MVADLTDFIHIDSKIHCSLDFRNRDWNPSLLESILVDNQLILARREKAPELPKPRRVDCLVYAPNPDLKKWKSKSDSILRNHDVVIQSYSSLRDWLFSPVVDDVTNNA